MMGVITYVICIIMDFLIAHVVIIILLVIITILMAVYIYPKVCKGGISKENDSSSPVMFNNILLEEIISSIISLFLCFITLYLRSIFSTNDGVISTLCTTAIICLIILCNAVYIIRKERSDSNLKHALLDYNVQMKKLELRESAIINSVDKLKDGVESPK